MNKTRKQCFVGLWLVLFVLVGTMSVLAQSQASTGQIAGTVRDNNGAVVPNATVKALNTETGLEQTATTTGEGLFRFVLLPVGNYTVTAEGPGFAPGTLSVKVSVGQTADAPVVLGVQGVSETINITAETIQTTRSEPDALLNERAIDTLPINGRRFQDFVTLTPTAQVDPQRGQISLSGQRGINSNVNIDGVDYNQPFFGGIRGGERSNTAFSIPQESIQEFQVVAAGYSAEFGRSTGGIVNAVTKSGSNELHGSAFYLLRHRELSRLTDYLKAQGANIEAQRPGTPFFAAPTQNQFGGSIGGPIKQNRAFFFGSIEAQRLNNERVVFFDRLTTVTPSATTQEAFNFYQGQQQPFTATNDVLAFLVRSDIQVNDRHRFNVRYSQSDNKAENANASGNALFPTTFSALSNNGTERDRTYTGVGQVSSIFSPSLVNELRTQYSREVRPREANVQSPTLSTNIGRTGTVSFLPTTQFDWRFQLADSLTYNRGNHTAKFGGEYNHVFADQRFGFNQFGAFNITGSNQNTILDILSVSRDANGNLTGNTLNRFDDRNVSYLRQIGNLQTSLKMDEVAFFGQDAWRIRPNFTLNYGLRWEAQYNPSPEATNTNLVNTVRSAQFPIGRRVDPSIIPDATDQWAPRVGFAYDPFNDTRTVIRGFAGVYYARTPALLFADPINNFRSTPGNLSVLLPFRVNSSNFDTIYEQFRLIGVDLNTTPLNNLPILTTAQVQSIAQELQNRGVLTGSADPFFGAQPIMFDNNFKNPRSFQAGGGIERELLRGFTVGADFSLVNTTRLQRNRDLNLPVPSVNATIESQLAQRPVFGLTGGTGRLAVSRPITTLGSVQVRESTARSLYRSFVLRSQLRRSWGQFSAFYTLSKSLSDDDNERDAGGISFENAFDLRSEYGPSRLDRRHQFVASPIFFLPAGFEVSSAIRLRSGRPIDASIGFDANEDRVFTDRPFSAPGVPFIRNSFRNLPLYDVDLRVQKGFAFGEDRRLVFSAEMFNLFNRNNIELNGSAVENYCSNPAPFNCGFGAPTNPNFLQVFDRNPNSPRVGRYLLNNNAGAPFQMQLGIRFQF